MEKILDRETTTEKPNGWIPVLLTNFLLLFITFAIYIHTNFLVFGIGVAIMVLLNTIVMLNLLFSSLSDWKKWAVSLVVILILILIITLYSYIKS